jgi:VanZ family protein
MPRDKLLHIVMGVGAVAITLLAVWLAQWRLGAAVALVTTTFGIFYEVQQWYRKEGQVDPWDAIATAAPGWLAWLVLEMMK